MKIVLVISGIVSWLLIGAIGGGFFLAELRAEFPDNYKDERWALKKRNKIILVSALFGPFSFVVNVLQSEFGYPDGWTWTAKPVKE